MCVSRSLYCAQRVGHRSSSFAPTTMQTAGYRPSPMHTASPTPTGDPVRASVAHLLARAHGIPCSAAAQAFAQLVQPAARFGIALDVLLPLLSGQAETTRRILAAYILYYMYATHPIAINPFRSAFAEVFVRERDVSRAETERGGVSENEQLVWVLWKILKGDGNDLGPYSPATLAQSPLPPKLRAAQLTIDDALTLDDDEAPGQVSGDKRTLIQSGTAGASPAPSAARTPIEGANEIRASPLPPGDDSKFEFLEHGMRLLLAACQRVLTLSEQRVVVLTLPHFAPHTLVPLHSLPPLLALNPALGHPLIVALLNTSRDSPSGSSFTRADVFDILRQLPPTLPSFDILGRLLRDPTIVPIADNLDDSREDRQQINGIPTTTIADLTRTEVLGSFVLNAIAWVERSELEAREGLISDDRAAKGVQNLCRFYNSLIKLGLIDPSSDVESAEMAHFALAHANYEDANALYRVLVMGKF
ncbi:uncharacterized protein FOMMEDRAFT_120314 [Fomitiporia mediterranea MF3/22]|uniref:uncharacterized protein n=1 Tax=Fomitiporia mediterranea (strain MF3/22) TaxID=694068 RepID=UPI0004409633|nr:uncharacterized protein FOMMEDRAFT_120314 [Fomitiporia mediterranea MF3/22]EJD05028.1 hypothetical protein FOMMEDRAFT_120314 [Fomitiporia mediterranea MF3/22]